MSLSSFFRDYVYIPLGGNRKGIARQYLNLFIVWVLTGIWHGAGWNFLLWGLYFFLILCIEKRIIDFKEEPSKGSYVARRSITLVLLFFGWILFRYSDMSVMLNVLGGLFCINGNPFWDLTTSLTLLNNCFLLPAAIVACTPIIPYLHSLLDYAAYKKRGLRPVVRVLSVVLPILLVVLSALYLAGQNYNPFLYTQF